MSQLLRYALARISETGPIGPVVEPNKYRVFFESTNSYKPTHLMYKGCCSMPTTKL